MIVLEAVLNLHFVEEVEKPARRLEAVRRQLEVIRAKVEQEGCGEVKLAELSK